MQFIYETLNQLLTRLICINSGFPVQNLIKYSYKIHYEITALFPVKFQNFTMEYLRSKFM